MRAAPLKEAMIGWRHALHAEPELGFEEVKTADRIAGLLQEFGLEVHRGIGGTGVVGVLRRGEGNRSIALRAELDALPIEEANDASYRSRHPGRAHLCGHDGHMAMLLGAARCLAESGAFDGRAVFVFQPDEENGRGARAMLDDGFAQSFGADRIYAMHNMPGLPLGHVATRAGAITASESLFEIEIAARGGHAALPHMGVDAITVGAQLVGALQTIVSRKLDPALNGVVSVTEFVTDGARNVLPGKAALRGDARALTPETTARIGEKIRAIAEGVCAAHEVGCTVSYVTEFQPTLNAPDAVAALQAAASDVFGEAQVDAACAPKLFSEDFAHFTAQAPGCFLLLGNGEEGRHARPLHSPDYEFNDEALVHGASLWTTLVERELAG